MLGTGVYGAGDPDDIEAVTARISECTGIDSDALTYVRSGAARGISFGKTSSAPARLVGGYSTALPRRQGRYFGQDNLQKL